MKTILRLLAKLLTLACVVLIIAWFWFDDEKVELNAETRARLDETFVGLPAGTVHYELAGRANGEVVVLVHGFSVPAYVWDPTFEFLVQSGYRVLRFDLFGRGYSDRPDVEYTIPLFADQLGDLVDALAIDTPFSLVGLSMGGPVVTHFTNRNMHRVKQLVLVDPLVFVPSKADIAPLDAPVLGEYLARIWFLPRLAKGQSDDFHDANHFPDWEARFRAQMQYLGFRRAILSTVRNLPLHDSLGEYARLGQLDLPVQLFWGRHDRTIPLQYSEKLLELIPGTRFDVIEDAGHLPQMEQPDVFNLTLLEFLNK